MGLNDQQIGGRDSLWRVVGNARILPEQAQFSLVHPCLVLDIKSKHLTLCEKDRAARCAHSLPIVNDISRIDGEASAIRYLDIEVVLNLSWWHDNRECIAWNRSFVHEFRLPQDMHTQISTVVAVLGLDV
eukprot:1154560-Rhodomonas_salina.1